LVQRAIELDSAKQNALPRISVDVRRQSQSQLSSIILSTSKDDAKLVQSDQGVFSQRDGHVFEKTPDSFFDASLALI